MPLAMPVRRAHAPGRMDRHPSEPPRAPSVARETVADLADDIQLVAQPFVQDILSRIAMVVLMVLLVPVGLIVLIVSFLTMGVLYGALNIPSGPITSIIAIAWLVGTILALVLVFRFLYRRLPRRLRLAWSSGVQPHPVALSVAVGASSRPLAGDGRDEPAASQRPAAPLREPTLAELDARFAPRDPGA
jgi:hypothetical protein